MTLFSKRWAALVTCVILTSSLLAGCGDTGKSTSTDSAGQAKPPFAGKKITVYVAITVNEEHVRKMAEMGHNWRNPVWRYKDGSIAEW